MSPSAGRCKRAQGGYAPPNDSLHNMLCIAPLLTIPASPRPSRSGSQPREYYKQFSALSTNTRRKRKKPFQAGNHKTSAVRGSLWGDLRTTSRQSLMPRCCLPRLSLCARFFLISRPFFGKIFRFSPFLSSSGQGARRLTHCALSRCQALCEWERPPGDNMARKRLCAALHAGRLAGRAL